MVGGRRERVGALRDHARGGHVAAGLLAGQVAADAGLGALADLDLDRDSAVQVVEVDAEAPRRHLHDHVVLEGVQVGVQAALAAVHHDAAALGRHGERLVHVERDRAVAHGREDDGRVELDGAAGAGERRGAGLQAVPAGVVGFDRHRIGLAAEVGAQLHGLAQRVDRRVGDLTGVEHEVVEDARVVTVVAGAGQHHAAGLGLAPDRAAQRRRPELVAAVGELALLDGDGVGRAVGHAAVAGAALGVVGQGALVEGEDAPAALRHAAPAAAAAPVVDGDRELRLHHAGRHLAHRDGGGGRAFVAGGRCRARGPRHAGDHGLAGARRPDRVGRLEHLADRALL